ncbi:MAG: flagellar biosynthetic protein FliO [Gammaproteobacteria bacterium]|nr:flagellar biosynthetic protein FliO [Gammaproteobacteria bacterium]
MNQLSAKYFLATIISEVILFSNTVQAAASDEILAESTIELSAFLKMFAGLAAVVALIFVLAWLSRKMKFVQNMTSGYQIKNLASLSLTTREKICLIEVGDKQVLVGIAPGRINQLHVFDEKIQVNSDNDSEATKNAFSSHFKNALGISKTHEEQK